MKKYCNLGICTNVGMFGYDNSAKPYAVTSVDLIADNIAPPLFTATYTSFRRPAQLQTTDGKVRASFKYNSNYDRVKMQTTTAVTNTIASLSTKYYLAGCYEAGTNYERLYLGGDYYSAPLVMVKSTTDTVIYHILRDHVGSITHVIEKVDGNRHPTLRQELSYDSWGRLRNPSTREVYDFGDEPELILGRGFGSHEYLPAFGLVNMNARLYDPQSGRFLSPDPIVQMPDNPQNFNRYAYCLNNPLRYLDPTGLATKVLEEGITEDGTYYILLLNDDGSVYYYRTSMDIINGEYTCTAYKSAGDSIVNPDCSPNFENLPNAINTTSTGLGSVNGIKVTLIENVVKEAPEVKGYLNVCKGLGTTLSVINIGFAINNLNEELQKENYSCGRIIKYSTDIVVGLVSIVSPFGTIIGAVYGLGDILTDGYWTN